MNPTKKVLVNYKKTRGIYEPINMVFNNKWNKTNIKDELRLQRRMKKLNVYDDDETNEPAIAQLTPPKTKFIFKFLNDYQNQHRLSRPVMPAEVKKEYIKKCKEFSLWRTNVWRHRFYEVNIALATEFEMLKYSNFLPINLFEEVMDFENTYQENDSFEEMSQNATIEADEFDPEFLYTTQYLRLLPDEQHIVWKTLINMPGYGEDEEGGKGDLEMGEGGEGDGTGISGMPPMGDNY